MLALMRIEPTPTGVEAGIKIKSVTLKTNLRSTSGPLRSHTVSNITSGLVLSRYTVSFPRLGVFKISEITKKMPS